MIDIDAKQAEFLLIEKSRFTYLLRKGDKENEYIITFVKEDLNIYHQLFTLEQDSKGWYYKNGCVTGLETLEEIIPRMMHCNLKECIVLNGS
ncbi:MAG: hypothetical protein HYZ47_03045 [Simkania negevensis]|nr:hypothetical protein [Simkania negevensis]